MGDTTTFVAPGARNLYLIKQSAQGLSPGSGCYESDAPIQELVDVFCDIHDETFELLTDTPEVCCAATTAPVTSITAVLSMERTWVRFWHRGDRPHREALATWTATESWMART